MPTVPAADDTPPARPPGWRRRVPIVHQMTAADCGAACLGMVLAYHGKRVGLEPLREFVGPGGTDAAAIVAAAQSFGLLGRGVKLESIADLDLLEPAAILHWRFNHFVVFERASRRGIEIVDPVAGRRRVTAAEASRSFTGIALCFEKGETFGPGTALPRGARRYWPWLRQHLGLLARILTSSLLIQLLAVAVPVLTGVIADRVVPRGDHGLLLPLTLGLSAIVLFRLLGSYLRAEALIALRTRMDAQMSIAFVEHLLSLPYAFFQQRSTGDLTMRLNSNATIREIVTSSALSGLLDGSLVCLYLLLVFVFDLRIGLVVLLLGALRALLLLATLRRQRELTADSLAVEAEAQGYQVQMLDGIAALKIGAAEPRALERWSNLFIDVLNANVRRARLNALIDAILEALATASPGVVLLYGAARVLAGDLTLGTMLALSALAVGFLDPLSKLVAMVAQLEMVHAYLDRIGDVLDAPREQQAGGRDLGKLAGRISVESLSFRYAPQAPFAVQDLNLEILPGQFIALVGRSGAGKTTFANLLLGIYAPTEGRVAYDGVDLRTLDLQALRRQLGVVPQLPGLLGGTVRDNITLGDPAIPLARVIDAARRAEIHDEIMAMPMGYNTILAGRGASISGGQRQRLALARALLHRPDVLLLDEATSELDGVSESLIAARLADLPATRIVIAHRLSTIRRAELILVLEQGRIVESGRHDELLARGAAYAQLVQAQLRESSP